MQDVSLENMLLNVNPGGLRQEDRRTWGHGQVSRLRVQAVTFAVAFHHGHAACVYLSHFLSLTLEQIIFAAVRMFVDPASFSDAPFRCWLNMHQPLSACQATAIGRHGKGHWAMRSWQSMQFKFKRHFFFNHERPLCSKDISYDSV